MKKIVIIIAIFFLHLNVNAQCFNIESILVDACGEPEGENEMVLITTIQSIDIDDLVFDWPDNSFLGWCSNASLTAQLNQTIISSCGKLLEPPSGIVPAGKKLIVVTSVDMLVSANSFEGLTETIYIIYQCSGNSLGHFMNSAGSKTLTVYYSGNCSQSQSRTYTSNSLIGGDGAAVEYDAQGNATYYNTGCNAIVPNTNTDWEFPLRICADIGLLDLNDFLSPSAATNGTWSGDIENGHYFNSANKFGNYSITYTLPNPSACLSIPDSTIHFEVYKPVLVYDTLVVCDSIKPIDVWLYESTTLTLKIPTNIYECDSTIIRYYDFVRPDFELDTNFAIIDNGQSHEFELFGLGDYTYEIYNNGVLECSSPCNVTVLSPNKTTNYIIAVNQDSFVCNALLRLRIEVIYHPKLNIPNTFTPNGDGENDVFKLFGKDLGIVQYGIYSKWGEMLFEGKDLENFWDGNFRNQAVETGSYLLVLNAVGLDGIPIKKVQHINLLR